MSVSERLAGLGLRLPAPAAPVANYLPYKLAGSMLYLSGMIPLLDGEPYRTGRLGAGVSLEEGIECARLCCLSALAWAKDALDGNLERIAGVIRVRGFVASTPDFFEQPKVLNGCSDLLLEVFGERGSHTRAAVGSVALPLNVPVEIDFLFSVDS